MVPIHNKNQKHIGSEGLVDLKKKYYLSFFLGHRPITRRLVKKIRYNCLCLWLNRIPFSFIRNKLREDIERRWLPNRKNYYMRCCKNPNWCGNVINQKWPPVYQRIQKDKYRRKQRKLSFSFSRLLKIRAKRLHDRCRGNVKLNNYASRLGVVVGSAAQLPYSSDFLANPLFKNYMRFTQQFGVIGARSDKVDGWLRLKLYRSLRYKIFKINLVDQLCFRGFAKYCKLGSVKTFSVWFISYLDKRWLRPGIFYQ